jgi:hypothetical protein
VAPSHVQCRRDPTPLEIPSPVARRQHPVSWHSIHAFIVRSSLHGEVTVEHAECFTGAVHAIMRDPQLLVLVPVLCDLLEI